MSQAVIVVDSEILKQTALMTWHGFPAEVRVRTVASSRIWLRPVRTSPEVWPKKRIRVKMVPP